MIRLNKKSALALKIDATQIPTLITIVKDFSSKEEAINQGYTGIKRSIKSVQTENKLVYCGGLLFVEDEWFKTNKSKLLLKIEGLVKEKTFCQECGSVYDNLRGLATHIQSDHKIKTEDYTVRWFYSGVSPACKELNCINTPRYCTFEFKEYCREHATIAMSIGGKIGGIGEAWNKGLTAFTDERIAKQAEQMLGPKNHFFGKHHTVKTTQQIRTNKVLSEQDVVSLLEKRSEEFSYKPFDYNAYITKQTFGVDVVCVKCGFVDTKILVAYERGSLCKKCFPFTVSKQEIEVRNFVESLFKEGPEVQVLLNDRKVLNPKELDVYIPSKNFAIEYNGLYWHMDRQDGQIFNKNSHQEKTNDCRTKGIQLFHIFSDEWEEKRELLESMIASRLGKSKQLVGARKLSEVKQTSAPAMVLREFFESSHISGYAPCCQGFYLEDPATNQIMCGLTVRRPVTTNFDKQTLEIARFANALDTNITGGFSKLFQSAVKWAKAEGYTKITSYCDLRFGLGDVYLNNGFKHIRDTVISYWYTDGIKRFDRTTYRAKDGKSEKEIAEEAEVYKIFGCSSKVYEMDIK